MTTDDSLFNTPPDLTCPITSELFYDPCINTAGHVYERKAIEKAMRSNLSRDGQMKDPLTNKVLTSNTLMQVHVVRGRAIEYREKTVKACMESIASSSSPIADLAKYLVRVSELILPPALTTELSSASASHASQLQPLVYEPGISGETASSILATSNSRPINSSHTAGLIVEKYAQGLLNEGLVDVAAGLYLRLLLQMGDGDRELQSRALKNCLECWASSPDPLHQLASYIESYPGPGNDGLGNGLQVIDLIEDGELALSLCERLLVRIQSSALPDEAREVARQMRTAMVLMQKASQLRLDMAMRGRAGKRGGDSKVALGPPSSKEVNRIGAGEGEGVRRQGGRSMESDEDPGWKKGGLAVGRAVRGLATKAIRWRGGIASGVFAVLLMVPRSEESDRSIVVKGIQAAAFLLAVTRRSSTGPPR